MKIRLKNRKQNSTLNPAMNRGKISPQRMQTKKFDKIQWSFIILKNTSKFGIEFL